MIDLCSYGILALTISGTSSYLYCLPSKSNSRAPLQNVVLSEVIFRPEGPSTIVLRLKGPWQARTIATPPSAWSNSCMSKLMNPATLIVHTGMPPCSTQTGFGIAFRAAKRESFTEAEVKHGEQSSVPASPAVAKRSIAYLKHVDPGVRPPLVLFDLEYARRVHCQGLACPSGQSTMQRARLLSPNSARAVRAWSSRACQSLCRSSAQEGVKPTMPSAPPLGFYTRRSQAEASLGSKNAFPAATWQLYSFRHLH